MEEMVSLGEMFILLKKRLLLIILTTVVGLAGALAVTHFFITPKFSASTELIVQSKNNSTVVNLQSDVNANVLLINTYKDMILGDVVLNAVNEKLLSERTYQATKSELTKMINVIQLADSQMFQIKVTTDDPEKSAAISNILATIFKEKATEVLDVSRVTVTSQAQSNAMPVSPNKKLNMVIGGLFGLALGIGIVFLLEILDKTVKDERFITETLALPILGTVNEMNSKELDKGRAVQVTNKTTENKEIKRVEYNKIKSKERLDEKEKHDYACFADQRSRSNGYDS